MVATVTHLSIEGDKASCNDIRIIFKTFDPNDSGLNIVCLDSEVGTSITSALQKLGVIFHHKSGSIGHGFSVQLTAEGEDNGRRM